MSCIQNRVSEVILPGTVVGTRVLAAPNPPGLTFWGGRVREAVDAWQVCRLENLFTHVCLQIRIDILWNLNFRQNLFDMENYRRYRGLFCWILEGGGASGSSKRQVCRNFHIDKPKSKSYQWRIQGGGVTG